MKDVSETPRRIPEYVANEYIKMSKKIASLTKVVNGLSNHFGCYECPAKSMCDTPQACTEVLVCFYAKHPEKLSKEEMGRFTRR